MQNDFHSQWGWRLFLSTRANIRFLHSNQKYPLFFFTSLKKKKSERFWGVFDVLSVLSSKSCDPSSARSYYFLLPRLHHQLTLQAIFSNTIATESELLPCFTPSSCGRIRLLWQSHPWISRLCSRTASNLLWTVGIWDKLKVDSLKGKCAAFSVISAYRRSHFFFFSLPSTWIPLQL